MRSFWAGQQSVSWAAWRHDMGTLWKWMAAALLAVTLVACGGGSDGPGGGPGDDLYAAYEKVGPGMSYDQVRDIVGQNHNNGQDETPEWVRYGWIENKDNANVTLLYVQIKRGGGVRGKFIGGPKGNFSRSY